MNLLKGLWQDRWFRVASIVVGIALLALGVSFHSKIGAWLVVGIPFVLWLVYILFKLKIIIKTVGFPLFEAIKMVWKRKDIHWYHPHGWAFGLALLPKVPTLGIEGPRWTWAWLAPKFRAAFPVFRTCGHINHYEFFDHICPSATDAKRAWREVFTLAYAKRFIYETFWWVLLECRLWTNKCSTMDQPVITPYAPGWVEIGFMGKLWRVSTDPDRWAMQWYELSRKDAKNKMTIEGNGERITIHVMDHEGQQVLKGYLSPEGTLLDEQGDAIEVRTMCGCEERARAEHRVA